MANTTGGNKVVFAPFSAEPGLNIPAAIPASATTFYSGQAVGRNKDGNMVQMDDTAKAEFIGILKRINRVTVNTTDSVSVNGVSGDKEFKIERPPVFTALIATLGSVGGQEGQKVWWLYNNQVSLTPGTSANFAGTIIHVKDSTHVTVLAPWMGRTSGGNLQGMISAAAAAGTTLTKFDVNKMVLLPLTSSEAITLPAANAVSPGDEFVFINTSANTSTPTITPAGSDKINGASSYAMSTAQYAKITVTSDGVSNWYVAAGNTGGTLGSTTFTGNVAVNSATLTVTDNSANSFSVGQNGSTNPAFNVDASTSSSITGVTIASAASGSGVTLSTTGGTNETLYVAPKGSGSVIVTTTGATGFEVGPNGATNPTFKVVCSVGSEAGGLSVTGGTDNNGVALAAIGSNTNEPLKLDGKGSGLISIGTSSTGGAILRTKSTTIAAGSTAINNANAVDEGFYYVTGADNTAAIILPASVAGKVVTVKNTVATAILPIFPPVNSQINAKGINNAYNIPNAGVRTFRCVSTTLWYTDPETIV